MTGAVGRWSAWLNAWTVLSLPGFCLGVLMWGPVRVVGMAVGTALVMTLVLVLVEHDRSPRSAAAWRPAARRIARVALCVATVTISTAVAGAIIPGGVLLLVLMMGVTCPPVIAVFRRGTVARRRAPMERARPERGTPTPAATAGETQPGPREMTDDELCLAWRGSYWSLREARNSGEKLTVVLQRESFLEELELRHAKGFEAWLASGAHAAEGPERFLDDAGDEGRSGAA